MKNGTRNSAVTILIVVVTLISTSGLKAFAADSDAKKSNNIIVADAIKRGAKKCLDRIESVTDQVLGDATVGAYVVTVDQHPDRGIYTAMISRQTQNGGTQMVSLSVSPDKECTATVDITSVWGAVCPRIGQRWFANYKPEVQLPGKVVVRAAGKKQQVFMVPLPNGCMTIQKETFN